MTSPSSRVIIESPDDPDLNVCLRAEGSTVWITQGGRATHDDEVIFDVDGLPVLIAALQEWYDDYRKAAAGERGVMVYVTRAGQFYHVDKECRRIRKRTYLALNVKRLADVGAGVIFESVQMRSTNGWARTVRRAPCVDCVELSVLRELLGQGLTR